MNFPIPRPSSSRRMRRASPAAWLAVALTAGSAAALAADAPPTAQKPLPMAIVDTFNQLSGGPHAGFRANHAKGVLVTGDFTPAPTAASLSKAPHFAKPVSVLVRFSNATGVPTLADADGNASPHGMAIRFQLPDGSNSDLVCISANGFPVATPEDFLALLQAVAASGPNAAKPTPIEQFLGSHPAALKFVTTPRPAPASFANLAFFGVNAFKFTNAQGESRFARYQILPVAGEKAFGDAAGKPGDHFLMDELPKRIAAAPVKFRIVAQLANPGDEVNNATVVWPADRPTVELGTLSLTKVAGDQVKAQRSLMFNPLALPAGIEPSADPVLLARPAAYAVSFGQRAQ